MVVSEKNLSTRREEYEEKGLKNILKGKKKKRRIHTLKPGRIMHYQIGPDTPCLTQSFCVFVFLFVILF